MNGFAVEGPWYMRSLLAPVARRFVLTFNWIPAGVRVPDDISVTGVDNTDLGATQTPPLTSIRTPIITATTPARIQTLYPVDSVPRHG